MITLCCCRRQLRSIVKSFPVVRWPWDAFFRTAAQCDVTANVQRALNSADWGRGRNCNGSKKEEGWSDHGLIMDLVMGFTYTPFIFLQFYDPCELWAMVHGPRMVKTTNNEKPGWGSKDADGSSLIGKQQARSPAKAFIARKLTQS